MNTPLFHISLFDLAFLGIIFTGLSFVCLLLFTKRINLSANRFLGMALLVAVLWIVNLFSNDIGLYNQLPIQFSLAFGPLIYLYVLKITRPEYRVRIKELLHFSPLVLELGFPQFRVVLNGLNFLSVIIYLYSCQRLIEDFYQNLKFNEVNDRYRFQLRWLRQLLKGFGLIWLLWIPYTIADYFIQPLPIPLYYPLYILLAIAFIRITVICFFKEDISVPLPSPVLSRPLVPAELRQKGEWLKELMKTNLYYRDEKLSLRKLAETVGMTPNELSRIINSTQHKSFTDFINEYRVDEVIRKMQDPAHDRITLIGIALDAGFNSKSTFNRIFKEMAGKNPAEFKRDIQNKLPGYTLRPSARPARIHSGYEANLTGLHDKLNRNIMLRTHFKTAWRNIRRGKSYSFLNIFGLSTGMAVSLIIGLWVVYQYSYDKFLPGHSRVYQVARNFYGNGDTAHYGGTSLKLADFLKNNVPEIEAVAETDGGSLHGLMVGTKKFYKNGNMVAPSFLSILPFGVVHGDVKTMLNDPYSIVLTTSTAKALFGNEDPVNKVVRIDNKNDLKVTGILADIPSNSTLQFDYLVPFSYLEATNDFTHRARTAGFGWTNFLTLVKLKEGVPYRQAAAAVRDIQKSDKDNAMAMTTNIVLDPLSKWHLYNKFENGKATGGFISYVRIFTLIGILVLIIACINFVNLTTAQSQKRAKEIGVRKAIGSGKSNLIWQFLIETFVLTLIAFIFSIVLVYFALPAFNALTGDRIQIPFVSSTFWMIVLACLVLTTLAAGSRPAFYLSSFNPVKVLKGTFSSGKAATLPRKILVVIQFSCSIALIISTFLIYQQIQYAKDRPTGYNRDGLMMTDMNEDLNRNYTVIRNELKTAGLASMVTTASRSITSGAMHRDLEDWPGKRPGEFINMGYIHVTDDYFNTVGMKLKDGRDFSGVADTMNVILNEAAVKLLRLNNPLNQLITYIDTRLRIIGVVKDAITSSPYTPADPTIFMYEKSPQEVILYRLKPGVPTPNVIANLSGLFAKFNPGYPFTYNFADESYAAKFRQEVLVGKLAGIFAAFAIFISCIGLFGLSAFVAEQRTKEIGIRKVLGASTSQAWLMLSKDFIILVLISSFIASPVALYFLSDWLKQFDYRISISPFVFIIAGLLALVITIITISFQSIKTAIANPVKSLRTE